jgi:hypothetical protein
MRGTTSSANIVMFLTVFHSGMSPFSKTTLTRPQSASWHQLTIVSATVSGEPQAMRPMLTMSSQVACVPSAIAASEARRRNSLVDT